MNDGTALCVAIYGLRWPAKATVQHDLDRLQRHLRVSDMGRALQAEPKAVTLVPAVPIKKSIKEDFMICLEDGRKFKSLKRHLKSAYGLSPERYRAKWGLPYDYPMVGPAYTRKRSELAKSIGLGSMRRKG